jgi:hypothetical protein
LNSIAAQQDRTSQQYHKNLLFSSLHRSTDEEALFGLRRNSFLTLEPEYSAQNVYERPIVLIHQRMHQQNLAKQHLRVKARKLEDIPEARMKPETRKKLTILFKN